MRAFSGVLQGLYVVLVKDFVSTYLKYDTVSKTLVCSSLYPKPWP